MQLRSVFASLPLLTQRLLAVLCVHFVRISATHPRKLCPNIAVPLAESVGAALSSPKFRPDQKNIKMKNTHNFLRNYCANRSPGDRQVLQNSWTQIGRDVDASRTAAKESGVLDHFMVQETQLGFFPARIRSVTRRCQRDISARDQILSDLFRFPSCVDQSIGYLPMCLSRQTGYL